MAIYTELPIYKHGCDLLSLALDVQIQMPRIFKRSLGEKIHTQCVDMLESMAMANASRGDVRVEQLDKLLQHLRATTAMLRVSHDKRLISPKLWAQSVELLGAVGAQAGGWRKQTLSNLSVPAALEVHQIITDASSPLQMEEAAGTVLRAFQLGVTLDKVGFLCPI